MIRETTDSPVISTYLDTLNETRPLHDDSIGLPRPDKFNTNRVEKSNQPID